MNLDACNRYRLTSLPRPPRHSRHRRGRNGLLPFLSINSSSFLPFLLSLLPSPVAIRLPSSFSRHPSASAAAVLRDEILRRLPVSSVSLSPPRRLIAPSLSSFIYHPLASRLLLPLRLSTSLVLLQPCPALRLFWYSRSLASQRFPRVAESFSLFRSCRPGVFLWEQGGTEPHPPRLATFASSLSAPAPCRSVLLVPLPSSCAQPFRRVCRPRPSHLAVRRGISSVNPSHEGIPLRRETTQGGKHDGDRRDDRAKGDAALREEERGSRR